MLQTPMNQLIALYLPNVGASLVIALIILTGVCRVTQSPLKRRLGFIISFIVCLIPIEGLSISHFARALTGDLSMTSYICFSLIVRQRLFSLPAKRLTESFAIAGSILLTAIFFYPSSLGLGMLDIYAFGFYPVVLAPIVFTVFIYCVWFDYRLPALVLAAGFSSFALGLLDSDNLWDYLIDPIIVLYAIGYVITQRKAFHKPQFTQEKVETGLFILIAVFLSFSVFLSRANPDAFRYLLVIEDGFTEWSTVIVLIAAMVVSIARVYRLRQARSRVFLGITCLIALLCLFGAGEEISWGQRIFGLETPAYFQGNNAQGEIGIHNLVVEINGEAVKLNKLIFGTGLALALLIYLFVATPLYRTRRSVRSFFNQIAAPMPRNVHIIGYLLVIATVELLIDSSKRGEMTEFAGAIVFALNVMYPYNPEIFDPDTDLA